jgi:hypothetical protein
VTQEHDELLARFDAWLEVQKQLHQLDQITDKAETARVESTELAESKSQLPA